MLGYIGWPAITGYERRIALSLRRGLAAIPGVRLLGPDLDAETLPVATFTVEGVHTRWWRRGWQPSTRSE